MVNKFLYKKLRLVRNLVNIVFYRLKNVSITTLVHRGSNISSDIRVGQYSYIASGAYICPKVAIGSFSMLAPNVMVTGKDHRFDIVGSPIVFSGRERLPETAIGDDVWIGANVIILAGVTIGNGSIVGAGSVVTKDVEECCIYVGNPAKKVRNRFETDNEKSVHLDKVKSGIFEENFVGTQS